MGLLDQKKIADQLIKTYEETVDLDLPKTVDKPVISRLAEEVPVARKVEVSMDDMLTSETHTELEEAGLSNDEKKILAKIEKLLHDENVSDRFGIAILSKEVANRAWIKIDDKPAIPAKVIARETSNFSLKNQVDEALKRRLKGLLVEGKTAEVIEELQKITEDNNPLNDEVSLVASNLTMLDQNELSNIERLDQMKVIHADLMKVMAHI